MREESHLDEMREAIRGDFQRLERRRGGQELLHVPEPVEQEPDAPTDAGDAVPSDAPARSWLERMLGR